MTAADFQPAIDKLRAWAGNHRLSAADWRKQGKMDAAILDERTAMTMDKAADLLAKQ